jgi:hypothetical protein
MNFLKGREVPSYFLPVLVLSSLDLSCLLLILTVLFSVSQTYHLSLPFPLRTVTNYLSGPKLCDSYMY